MGNIYPQKLVTLISKYLDKEKLMKENPSVTKEMIDALLQDIFLAKHGKEPTDTHQSCLPAPHRQAHHETAKHKQKDTTDLVIHTDGASRGNPGKSGIGVAIFDKNYHLLEEICKFIGESTNNVAEYQAMILAAQKAVACNARRVTFKTDSELLVRQLNGAYRVKSQNILPLYHELTILLGKIPEWKIQHVRREENVCADALANQGIDSAHRHSTA